MNTRGTGLNLTSIREENIALVIRGIHRSPYCARVDLASMTGLKQATITKIVGLLMDWGLVVETGSMEGKRGRRSIGLALNLENDRLIGVRLNRAYVTVGVFDIGGKLYETKTSYIDAVKDKPQDVMEIMVEMCKAYIRKYRDFRIPGIGVALPGPFMRSTGRIALMTGFPGWEEIDIAGAIEEACGVPAVLEHDANCGALAEWWYGNYAGCENILYVLTTDGVGAGIIADNQLYRGHLGVAGEVGHMSIDYHGAKCECGNRGCLELYCSTTALVNAFREEVLGQEDEEWGLSQDAASILCAARDGHAAAQKVYARTIRYLGLSLASMINILNPHVIIIGDMMALPQTLLLNTLHDTLKKRLLPEIYDHIEVATESFAIGSTLFGASALVLEGLLKQPTFAFAPAQKG